jgi:hypothetical protein
MIHNGEKKRMKRDAINNKVGMAIFFDIVFLQYQENSYLI